MGLGRDLAGGPLAFAVQDLQASHGRAVDTQVFSGRVFEPVVGVLIQPRLHSQRVDQLLPRRQCLFARRAPVSLGFAHVQILPCQGRPEGR
jgi:hypothetical protein